MDGFIGSGLQVFAFTNNSYLDLSGILFHIRDAEPAAGIERSFAADNLGKLLLGQLCELPVHRFDLFFEGVQFFFGFHSVYLLKT